METNLIGFFTDFLIAQWKRIALCSIVLGILFIAAIRILPTSYEARLSLYLSHPSTGSKDISAFVDFDRAKSSHIEMQRSLVKSEYLYHQLKDISPSLHNQLNNNYVRFSGLKKILYGKKFLDVTSDPDANAFQKYKKIVGAEIGSSTEILDLFAVSKNPDFATSLLQNVTLALQKSNDLLTQEIQVSDQKLNSDFSNNLTKEIFAKSQEIIKFYKESLSKPTNGHSLLVANMSSEASVEYLGKRIASLTEIEDQIAYLTAAIVQSNLSIKIQNRELNTAVLENKSGKWADAIAQSRVNPSLRMPAAADKLVNNEYISSEGLISSIDDSKKNVIQSKNQLAGLKAKSDAIKKQLKDDISRSYLNQEDQLKLQLLMAEREQLLEGRNYITKKLYENQYYKLPRLSSIVQLGKVIVQPQGLTAVTPLLYKLSPLLAFLISWFALGVYFYTKREVYSLHQVDPADKLQCNLLCSDNLDLTAQKLKSWASAKNLKTAFIVENNDFIANKLAHTMSSDKISVILSNQIASLSNEINNFDALCFLASPGAMNKSRFDEADFFIPSDSKVPRRFFLLKEA